MLMLVMLSSEIVSLMQAYLFNDYWEDIGTIKSFFDSNLALTQQVRLVAFQIVMYAILQRLCYLRFVLFTFKNTKLYEIKSWLPNSQLK